MTFDDLSLNDSLINLSDNEDEQQQISIHHSKKRIEECSDHEVDFD